VRQEERRGRNPNACGPAWVAFVWDYLSGQWRPPERSDLRPGATVLLDASVGGYDIERGLDVASRAPVPEVPFVDIDLQDLTDAEDASDELSQAPWQTIAFHGASVEAQVRSGMAALIGSRLGELVGLAARWHDVGKSHPAFQGRDSRRVAGPTVRTSPRRRQRPGREAGRRLSSQPSRAARPNRAPVFGMNWRVRWRSSTCSHGGRRRNTRRGSGLGGQ
jgi:hypothetical protein